MPAMLATEHLPNLSKSTEYPSIYILLKFRRAIKRDYLRQGMSWMEMGFGAVFSFDGKHCNGHVSRGLRLKRFVRITDK
jgi:hypothetical protein